MVNYLQFSENIKEIRTKRKMTQNEFCKIVGCTQATLSAYENNTKKPSLEIVFNIAKEFKVSIDWLLGISDKDNLYNSIINGSDLIKVLAILKRDVGIEIDEVSRNGIEIDGPSGYPEEYTYMDIGIFLNEPSFSNYLKEWHKMLDLLEKDVIDSEVYELWVEKTSNKYKEIYFI